MIKKILNNDYILSFVKKLINIFLGFFTLIFLNRYLGVILKGEYTYILNYTTIISTILQLGISSIYPKFKRKRLENCYEVFMSLSIILFVLYLFISIFLIILFKYNINIILISIVSCFSIFTSQVRYINLVENYKYNSIVVIIMSFINFLFMMFVYYFFQSNIVIAFMVLLLKDISVIIMFLPKINFKNLFRKTYFKVYPSILIQGFLPMLSSLLVMINYKLDVIMLKFMDISYLDIGLYSVGLSIAEYIWLIPEIFKDVVQKRTSKDNSINSINFSLRMSSTIIVFAFLILIIFGKIILSFMFGVEYVDAYDVMIILFLGVYSMMYYKLIGTLFLADNKSFQYFIILLSGAIINIVLNFILIPYKGIVGAAFASVFSYTFIGIIFLIIYLKKYGVSFKNILFVNKKDILLIKKFINNKY